MHLTGPARPLPAGVIATRQGEFLIDEALFVGRQRPPVVIVQITDRRQRPTFAVVPRKLQIPARSRAIGERTGLRNGKVGPPAEVENVRSYSDSTATQFESFGIERLGHERAIEAEHEVSGPAADRRGKLRTPVGMREDLIGLAIQGPYANSGIARAGADGEIDETVPVRQERREMMGDLGSRCVEGGDRLRLSARSRDLEQPAAWMGSKDNVAGASPSSAASDKAFAHDLRWSTGEFDTLQLVDAEERQRLAIGRPEWESGQHGPGYRLRPEGVQRAHPEHLLSLLNRSEYDLSAVWRYRRILDLGACWGEQR